MENHHKLILQKLFPFMADNIRADSLDQGVLYILTAQGVVTPAALKRVTNFNTKREQVQQLLVELENSGPEAYPKFIEILQLTGHYLLVHLAQLYSTTLQHIE